MFCSPIHAVLTHGIKKMFRLVEIRFFWDFWRIKVGYARPFSCTESLFHSLFYYLLHFHCIIVCRPNSSLLAKSSRNQQRNFKIEIRTFDVVQRCVASCKRREDYNICKFSFLNFFLGLTPSKFLSSTLSSATSPMSFGLKIVFARFFVAFLCPFALYFGAFWQFFNYKIFLPSHSMRSTR